MKDIIERYCVKPGSKVSLADWDPSTKQGLVGKSEGRELLEENRQKLSELQYRLYAEGKQSLLIILQGMDTSGKDGTIRHVMGGLNPQGCRVVSFKAPTEKELAHDFLWRVHQSVPAKGEIGIFNRSHYEDVLIARVRKLVPKKVWSARYDMINQFEKLLAESGVTILKFFLYISKQEQKERLRARLDNPDKHWKFNPGDLEERKIWDDYIKAYEDALENCSTGHAPWYVVPSDRKWYRNVIISTAIKRALSGMKPQLPSAEFDPSTFEIE